MRSVISTTEEYILRLQADPLEVGQKHSADFLIPELLESNKENLADFLLIIYKEVGHLAFFSRFSSLGKDMPQLRQAADWMITSKDKQVRLAAVMMFCDLGVVGSSDVLFKAFQTETDTYNKKYLASLLGIFENIAEPESLFPTNGRWYFEPHRRDGSLTLFAEVRLPWPSFGSTDGTSFGHPMQLMTVDDFDSNKAANLAVICAAPELLQIVKLLCSDDCKTSFATLVDSADEVLKKHKLG